MIRDLTSLAALANDLQLRLTAVALDDLSPAEADELGDAQAAVVGDLEHQAVTPGIGRVKWSAFLATAEKGVYFATYRGNFIAPEPSQVSARDDLA